jgi:seryl-tRNA synthetase
MSECAQLEDFDEQLYKARATHRYALTAIQACIFARLI